MIDALMLIPAEPQIVYPSGIGRPGPAHGGELGPEQCIISKLRLRESRICYALRDSGTIPQKIRSRQRVMITQMVINFAQDVINTDDVGETIVLVDAVGVVGPVKRQQVQAELIVHESVLCQVRLTRTNAGRAARGD